MVDRKCNFGRRQALLTLLLDRVATQQCCQEQQAQINDAAESAVRNMFFIYCIRPLGYCTIYSQVLFLIYCA